VRRPAPSPTERAAAPVAVVRTAADREQVIADVGRAVELAGWRRFVTPGADLALKPNLGWDKLIPGAISAPWVVEGVIVALRAHVGTIFLVESDQVVLDVERTLRLTGLDEVCRRHGVTWCNMSRGQAVRFTDDGRRVLRDVNLPEILTRTELITLPLLKTHNKTTITGALKNQWGCLETLRHSFHLVLADAIADVNVLLQPRFAVMDGTVGLEGNGPKAGIPRVADLVLASGNLVGLDAVAARVMGFDPERIPHLLRCAEEGLGSVTGFAVAGAGVDDLRQEWVPARHNAVSWLELALRRSALRRLVFHTPLFRLMCWGARRYYDVWDAVVGRRYRRDFAARSGYAAQWPHIRP
jgi:uncharacterized protein (DUF362 family)